MKYSILFAATLLAFSSASHAKKHFVSGDIKNIDRENLEISIAQKGGNVKEYKIDSSAAKDLRNFKKGDNVVLELGLAKLK